MGENMWYPVVWWVVTAVVFFILELVTTSFFFMWIGAGAVVTALLSMVVDKSWIQYTTFAFSSILLIAFTRRWASLLSGKATRPSNVDSLVGQIALITKVSSASSWQGYLKVGGESWKAESENREPLVENSQATVVAVRSNVLVVKVL